MTTDAEHLLIFQNQLEDGRHLAVAVAVDENSAGEVVTIGTGTTSAEAMADCKNDLLSLGYSTEMLDFRAISEKGDAP